MGIHTLWDDERAIMYCSVTDWAFGPVFFTKNGHDAVDRMELFIDWLPLDPRKYNDNELEQKYHEFLGNEKELWAAKERETDDE